MSYWLLICLLPGLGYLAFEIARKKGRKEGFEAGQLRCVELLKRWNRDKAKWGESE